MFNDKTQFALEKLMYGYSKIFLNCFKKSLDIETSYHFLTFRAIVHTYNKLNHYTSQSGIYTILLNLRN